MPSEKRRKVLEYGAALEPYESASQQAALWLLEGVTRGTETEPESPRLHKISDETVFHSGNF